MKIQLITIMEKEEWFEATSMAEAERMVEKAMVGQRGRVLSLKSEACIRREMEAAKPPVPTRPTAA